MYGRTKDIGIHSNKQAFQKACVQMPTLQGVFLEFSVIAEADIKKTILFSFSP